MTKLYILTKFRSFALAMFFLGFLIFPVSKIFAQTVPNPISLIPAASTTAEAITQSPSLLDLSTSSTDSSTLDISSTSTEGSNSSSTPPNDSASSTPAAATTDPNSGSGGTAGGLSFAAVTDQNDNNFLDALPLTAQEQSTIAQLNQSYINSLNPSPPAPIPVPKVVTRPTKNLKTIISPITTYYSNFAPVLSSLEPFTQNSPYGFEPLSPTLTRTLYLLALGFLIMGSWLMPRRPAVSYSSSFKQTKNINQQLA